MIINKIYLIKFNLNFFFNYIKKKKYKKKKLKKKKI